MKRSLFPENVEVHQADLERTESTKAEEIKARTADGSRINRDGDIITPGGVVDGLRVTVSASPNAARLDISSGSAYTPSGERIVVETTQLAVALSDPTLSTANVVCLVYTETLDTLRPHETAGTTHSTAANASFRVAVYTQAEYDALPETNDDLSEDAQDRVVMLARVTGSGAGVDLTSGNISQTALPSVHYGVRYTGGVLNGINLRSISDVQTPSPFTSDTARLQIAIVSSTVKNLSFRDAGTATFGTAVNIHGLSSATVSSAAGTDLTVDIMSDLLNKTTGTEIADLTVERIYDAGPFNFAGATGALHAPSDLAHRGKTGSIAPSSVNPHGLAVGDLAQSFLQAARSIDLGRSIAKDSEDIELARVLTSLHKAADLPTSKLLFWETPAPLSSMNVIRAYYDSATNALEFTANARYSNQTNTYISDASGAGRLAYRLQLIGGDNQAQLRLDIGTAGSSVAFRRVFHSGPTLSSRPHVLELGTPEFDRDTVRVIADGYDSATVNSRTHLFSSRPIGTTENEDTINVYRVNGTSSTSGDRSLEFVYNAVWDHNLVSWSAYNTGTPAYKLELSQTQITVWRRPTPLVAWIDTGWGSIFSIDIVTGAVTVVGLNATDIAVSDDLTVGDTLTVATLNVTGDLDVTGDATATDYIFSPTKTGYIAIPPAAGIGRVEGTAVSRYEPIASGSPFTIPSGGPTTPSSYAPYWRVTSSNAADEAVAEFPLHAPHGVTLTHLQVQADVDDTGGSPRVRIIRVPVTTGGSPTYASLSDTLLSDTGGAPAGTSIGLSIVVDNLTYAYYIVFGDSAGAPSSTVKVYGMRVTYSTSMVRV